MYKEAKKNNDMPIQRIVFSIKQFTVLYVLWNLMNGKAQHFVGISVARLHKYYFFSNQSIERSFENPSYYSLTPMILALCKNLSSVCIFPCTKKIYHVIKYFARMIATEVSENIRHCFAIASYVIQLPM